MHDLFITIGFSTPRKKWLLLAWLIRTTSKTKFSHTYIRIHSRTIARSLIYHAAGSEIHFSNFNNFVHKNEIVNEFQIPVSEMEYAEVLQHLYDNLEIPYGRKQLVGNALVEIVKSWFSLNIPNPWRDGKKTQTCLELTANVLKLLGWHSDENVEDQDMRWIYAEVERFVRERVSCYENKQKTELGQS